LQKLEMINMHSRLKHFEARHPGNLKVMEMYYYSMKQAKRFNPTLIDWKELINFTLF